MNETRTYKITGGKYFLDQLEKAFALIQYMGDVGHSSGILIGVDGDGGCRLKFEGLSGTLSKEDRIENERISFAKSCSPKRDADGFSMCPKGAPVYHIVMS